MMTVSAAISLAGCSSMTVNTFCLTAEPISWSGKDTNQTIRQVKAHNAVGKELCGWGRK